MATVGVIYTLRCNSDGEWEGPVNKRVYGTFQSPRALFERLLREATLRGLGTDRIQTVEFVADGARGLWKLQQEFFPTAVPCLDWFHSIEKLWRVGQAVFVKDAAQRAGWVQQQRQSLRSGKVRDVMLEFTRLLEQTPTRGPGNKERRHVLEKVLAYFTRNQHRMRYDALRAMNFDIGSGVIEGAVRHLIGVRHDGPGMRWGLDRMEAILQLRVLVVNGQWEAFTQFLERQPQVHLPAEPIAARSHDAKTKVAA